MKERGSWIRRGGLTPKQAEYREKNRRIIRIISAVMFIAAMGGISYLLFPLLKGFGRDGYLDELRETISGYGRLHGLAMFLAIQALQVVVAVIPAIQVVGGLLYGWFVGGLLAYAGIILGSLAVWFVVRWLGAPLVEAMVSEKHIKRFAFLDDERRLIIILIILYTIPGVPKDVITYLVPLTKIKLRDFLIYVMPFRLPAIFLSTAFGSNVTSGNYLGAIIVVAAIALIAVTGLIIKDKLLDFLNKRSEKSRLHKSRD